MLKAYLAAIAAGLLAGTASYAAIAVPAYVHIHHGSLTV